MNTVGSYRCLCNKGYEVGNGGSHCIGESLRMLLYFSNTKLSIHPSIISSISPLLSLFSFAFIHSSSIRWSFHLFLPSIYPLFSLFFPHSIFHPFIHSFIPFIIFLSHSLISYSRLVITLHRMIIYLTVIRVIPFYTSQFVTMSIQQMCGWVTASKSLTRKVALNLMDARWEKPCAVVPLEPAGVTHVNCARRKILVSILLSYNTSWLVIF